jgi:carbamoyl-phosphate synthase large subunit
VGALATQLAELGFRLIATEGTAEVIRRAGVPVERVYKVTEGLRPHIVDRMKNGEVALVINTPEGRSARLDSYSIRRTAVTEGIPYFTTMAAASATAEAIRTLRQREMGIRSLQEYHATV